MKIVAVIVSFREESCLFNEETRSKEDRDRCHQKVMIVKPESMSQVPNPKLQFYLALRPTLRLWETSTSKVLRNCERFKLANI